MLFLFLNWCRYWSWPTVSNPIPFSQPCGQPSTVIWSDPEVYSEPWMDLYVVLVGFGPFHSQLGFEVTPLVWLFQSELLLIKPSSDTVMTVVSMAPRTDTAHFKPEHTNAKTYWNIDTDKWTLWYMSHTYCTIHTTQFGHYSHSCWDRIGFNHFMLSRNLRDLHI